MFLNVAVISLLLTTVSTSCSSPLLSFLYWWWVNDYFHWRQLDTECIPHLFSHFSIDDGWLYTIFFKDVTQIERGAAAVTENHHRSSCLWRRPPHQLHQLLCKSTHSNCQCLWHSWESTLKATASLWNSWQSAQKVTVSVFVFRTTGNSHRK